MAAGILTICQCGAYCDPRKRLQFAIENDHKFLHLWLIYLVKDGECPSFLRYVYQRLTIFESRFGENSDDQKKGVTK